MSLFHSCYLHELSNSACSAFSSAFKIITNMSRVAVMIIFMNCFPDLKCLTIHNKWSAYFFFTTVLKHSLKNTVLTILKSIRMMFWWFYWRSSAYCKLITGSKVLKAAFSLLPSSVQMLLFMPRRIYLVSVTRLLTLSLHVIIGGVPI